MYYFNFTFITNKVKNIQNVQYKINIEYYLHRISK